MLCHRACNVGTTSKILSKCLTDLEVDSIWTYMYTYQHMHKPCIYLTVLTAAADKICSPITGVSEVPMTFSIPHYQRYGYTTLHIVFGFFVSLCEGSQLLNLPDCCPELRNTSRRRPSLKEKNLLLVQQILFFKARCPTEVWGNGKNENGRLPHSIPYLPPPTH